VVSNVRRFTFGKGDSHGKFTNCEFIYLSFLSINGCSLEVNYKFQEAIVIKSDNGMMGAEKDKIKNTDIKAINESLKSKPPTY
jgi:hypothetical protein